jgi:hypothetical protein
MRPRPVLAAAALLLAVTLAASCGSPATDAASTTAPLNTPEAVASAFAASYAAGDTVSACLLASGDAFQQMTSDGACAHTQWPAVEYWPGRTCQFSEDPKLGNLSGLRMFDYHSNGGVNGFPDFVIGLSGAGDSWRVTYLSADGGSVGMMSRLCKLAGTTGPTS